MSSHVLGVRIDNYSKGDAINKVKELLNASSQSAIFTPNPEMLVAAKRHLDFQNVLNTSKLNICDGMGIFLVQKGSIKRITGIDFMLDICGIAAKEGKRIYLAGSGNKEVVRKAAENLLQRFPGLHIVGTHPGPKISIVNHEGQIRLETQQAANDALVDDIIALSPDILFVGFGHIKQELWIHEHLEELPSVKIAMGVGGSLDVISGKIRRAPKLFRKLGMEWLWRLLRQPWRLGRVFTAIVIFPLLCLLFRRS